ncbi:hypothetical protein J6590_056337 [Homalodisca vitripennis]|nr:hypothetical protein J6590_056337 [Homalodisca vitripennis]
MNSQVTLRNNAKYVVSNCCLPTASTTVAVPRETRQELVLELNSLVVCAACDTGSVESLLVSADFGKCTRLTKWWWRYLFTNKSNNSYCCRNEYTGGQSKSTKMPQEVLKNMCTNTFSSHPSTTQTGESIYKIIIRRKSCKKPGVTKNYIKVTRSYQTACESFVMEYKNRNGTLQNGGRDHNMLAAYGVYATDREETPYYPEHVVVVTTQRDGSTTNSIMRGGSVAESAYGLCWCKSTETPTVDSPWYKPAVLLIVLALLLVVFLLVSGILVYFNRKPHSDYCCEM